MKFIKALIENLKEPKKKSITLLIIYLLFFMFVFIVTHLGGNTGENYNNLQQEKKDSNKVLNYEYIVTITDNSSVSSISGSYKKDMDDNIKKYEYDTVELLIDNSDSQTKYKDSDAIVYNIGLYKFLSLLGEQYNCDTIDCSVIYVPITIHKDTFIKKVSIDLSEYYGHNYTIEIEYDNINK